MAVINSEADRTQVFFQYTKYHSGIVMSDLLYKVDLRTLVKQSRRYYWSIVIVSAFYSVPVFQLIVNYMKVSLVRRFINSLSMRSLQVMFFIQVLHRTGEYDLCYYNYFCAHPFGLIPDFNHMYSNIGYILCGLSFVVIVRIRQLTSHTQHFCRNKKISEKSPVMDTEKKSFWKLFPKIDGRLDHGVVMHYGLFYAMGFSLAMTGIMSAAYHVCPNQNNFQFGELEKYI